jgi:hypothetical protein
MLELTQEQRRALAGDRRLRDPETNETYVLVREDQYEHMRRLLEGFTRSAGWDDPSLDAYQQHREQR